MAGSAVDWGLAERVAVRACGQEPFARSYHADSLAADFAEFTELAEQLVGEETGLHSLAGPARGRVVDRPAWIRANLASFQRLLRPVVDKFAPKLDASPIGSIARRVTGAEVGMVLGWMSGRVLGQYDLLIIEDEHPDEQDLVYYVGPNVLAIEKQFAFPPREFRLWLALHEVTHRAQFTGVPWMREHFLGLVERTVSSVDPDPARLFEAVGRAADSVRTGNNPLADGGLAMLLATPEQRTVLEEVSGLMSLLEGHGDITMDRAGRDLVPSAERFSRVLAARRQQAKGVTKLIGQILGLEAKLAQYAQGEAFIRAVEREDPALLDRAWEHPDLLPSLGEIRDPDSWLDRIRPVALAT